jgi:hypothetical protein
MVCLPRMGEVGNTCHTPTCAARARRFQIVSLSFGEPMLAPVVKNTKASNAFRRGNRLPKDTD